MLLPSMVRSAGSESPPSKAGGKQIDVDRRFARNDPGGYPPRPAGEEGHAVPAIEALPLAAAEPTRAPLIPGAIIAGEDDQRVVSQAVPVQDGQKLAHTPVDLLYRVAEDAALGAVAERLRRVQRAVREGVREVEEERTLLRRQIGRASCRERV